MAAQHLQRIGAQVSPFNDASYPFLGPIFQFTSTAKSINHIFFVFYIILQIPLFCFVECGFNPLSAGKFPC